MSERRVRWLTVVLWLCTAICALGIGVAGVTKFPVPNRWQPLYLAWGYPAWLIPATGLVEVGGAVLLFIPRLALGGAGLLLVVMTGALITLLLHPGGPMGWGATPTVYIVLLAVIATIRRRMRLGKRRDT